MLATTRVVRHRPPFVSTPEGTTSIMLDHSVPYPGGAEPSPGQTWNYQAWFRDFTPGGSGFNFSNGIAITYGP